MAATGIGNSLGAVGIFDGGNPRTIGGYARNEIISGGVLVFASGATGVVGSGANTFATSDLLFSIDASGGQFNGIALNTTAVSGTVTVATRGAYLLACNGSVIPGTKVVCDGNNAVSSWCGNGNTTGSPDIWAALGYDIGRAVTAGASGGYALIDIHG